jgi:Tfp pilus assembly protein PilV
MNSPFDFRRNVRNGNSLLEVLIATSILLVSIAAIGNHISVGVQAGLRVQLESEASWHCQTILQEAIAAPRRLSTSVPLAIPNHKDWLYQVDIKDDPTLNLDLITVTVWKPGKHEKIARMQLAQFISNRSIPETSPMTVIP